MKRKNIAALSAVAIALLCTANVEAGSVRPQDDSDHDYAPTGKGWGESETMKKGALKGSAGTTTKRLVSFLPVVINVAVGLSLH